MALKASKTNETKGVEGTVETDHFDDHDQIYANPNPGYCSPPNSHPTIFYLEFPIILRPPSYIRDFFCLFVTTKP